MPDCPNQERECRIDPVDLEHRLTRIEESIKRLPEIEKKLDKVLDVAKPGMSGGGVAGLTTVISAILIGVIEAIKSYFSKG